MTVKRVYGEELYHHGILGQKWGIRRYQNEDGTLTAEGKERLRKYKEKNYRRTNTDRAKALSSTDADTMSKVKSRQSKFTNALDPDHSKNDKAIESNNKFIKTAEEAYKNINDSLKRISYDDMLKEEKAVRTLKIGAAAVSALPAVAAGLLLSGSASEMLVMAGASALAGSAFTSLSGATENVRYRTRKYNQIMSENLDK